jgi:hypothetical protein
MVFSKKTPTNAMIGAGAWPWADGERHRTMMQSAEEQIKKMRNRMTNTASAHPKELEKPTHSCK